MTKINIKSINQKTSKAGKPFWTVEGSDGVKYSVWEEDIAEQIKAGITVDVEVMKKDKYNNIVEFNKVLESKVETKETSSYDISYAKDILVAMISKHEKVDATQMLVDATIAAQCVNNIKEVLNGNKNNQEGDDSEELTIQTIKGTKDFFTVINGEGNYEVILWQENGVLKHSCTCPFMTKKNPFALCSHKLAVLLRLVDIEEIKMKGRNLQ